MFRYVNLIATITGYITISMLLYSAYQTVPRKIKKLIAQPKFKVGDCIRSYDSFEHKIIKIFPMDGLQGPQYGYTVGADCHGYPNYFDCSTSIGDVDIVNESSVKIECPKK